MSVPTGSSDGTVVVAQMLRSYSPSMFADITEVPHLRAWAKVSGLTTLTFADHLEPAVATAVWERMTSRDDADQALRAEVRDLRVAVMLETATAADVLALAVATSRYVLPDPPAIEEAP